ncbi:unnamed protein product [Victoria cruziana]
MRISYLISGLLLVLLVNFSGLTVVSGDFDLGDVYDDVNQAWKGFFKFSGCHKGDNVTGLDAVKKYLKQFGYLDDGDDGSDEFDDGLEEAVRTYQMNFDLNVTGSLNNETVRQLVKPRCGVGDIINGTSSMKYGRRLAGIGHSVAHYSFFPGRPTWPAQASLTYAFRLDNQPFTAAQLRPIIIRSFARWQAATSLKFSEAPDYSSADLRLGFFRRDHGDGEPFDGPLGTLAHAFSPQNGRLHFDADENWVIDVSGLSSAGSVDLESVMVHEIGHLLGLGHSSDRESVMFPTLLTGTKKVELNSDDVRGIQSLYGGNPNGNFSVPSQQSERSGAAPPLFCSPILRRFGIILSAVSFCFLL